MWKGRSEAENAKQIVDTVRFTSAKQARIRVPKLQAGCQQ
jgi:hypothetical protein